MYTVPEFILMITVISCIGVLLGLAVRRHTQKRYCPYCACKGYCVIGRDIKSAVPDEKLLFFACRKVEE